MSINGSDKKAFKAGIWYTIANFLTKGAVFITTPFFTRLMTTDQMGEYSNVSSWLLILVPIVTFDMYTTINVARFDYRDELDGYASSILLYGTVVTALIYFRNCFQCLQFQFILFLSICWYIRQF